MLFCACTENGFSSYCCSAVSRSSIAKPPPFLGVSSLNLAAPRSGHFFCACAVLLPLGCVARAHVLTHAARDAPAQGTKVLAQLSDCLNLFRRQRQAAAAGDGA